MNWKLKFSIALLIALAIAGCGVQSGRFVTTGSTSYPLLSPVGSIDIVDGYATKSDDASDKHLLYVLIVTSASQEHSSNSHDDYGKYVTTLAHTWNTEKGTIAVSIPWDRQKDVVTIGKQEFIRQKGNVFVVRVNNGEIAGQQLGNLGTPNTSQTALEYIRQQFTNDELISSVKLYK